MTAGKPGGAPRRAPAADARDATAGRRPEVHVYCDGACSPNPGTGGWGAVLISPGHGGRRKEISGAEARSTNNRMELTAALMALRTLKKPCDVTIFTDSRYVRDAFAAGWLTKWQRNGWQTASRQPVLNKDLWQELLALTRMHAVRWEWVAGHGACEENNRADRLAVEAREALARGPAPHR